MWSCDILKFQGFHLPLTISDLDNMRSVSVSVSCPIEYGYKDRSRFRFGCRLDKQGMEGERESSYSEMKM